MDTILPQIESRRSAMAFASEPIAESQIKLLVAAASLAPSSNNEQPWRFYVASRENVDGFNLILSCLAPGNQIWAQYASVLIATATLSNLSHNGLPNYHAMHDLGLATSNLLLQAESMGLVSHVMGGFDHEKIRINLNIPDSQQIGAVIAVGIAGSLDNLNERNRARALSLRSRKNIDEILVELK